ncbi:MAG: hypothetical protein ACRDIB_19060, partial [Ardenticatenaceae bacterium]
MEELLPRALAFIDRWSYVFYIVGGLGVLLYLLRARDAFRQRRYTPFPIEREESTAMLRDSFIILTILVAILATTYYIDRVLLSPPAIAADNEGIAVAEATSTPTSPAIGPSPTSEATASVAAPETTPPSGAEEGASATLESAQTPPPGESPTVAQPTATSPQPPTAQPTTTEPPPPTEVVEVSPIPTQPPPPTDTPVPTQPPAPPTATSPPPPPPVPAASCGSPGVQITSPGNGQAVNGTVGVFGTANIDRFQFYKLEYAPAGSG